MPHEALVTVVLRTRALGPVIVTVSEDLHPDASVIETMYAPLHILLKLGWVEPPVQE